MSVRGTLVLSFSYHLNAIRHTVSPEWNHTNRIERKNRANPKNRRSLKLKPKIVNPAWTFLNCTNSCDSNSARYSNLAYPSSGSSPETLSLSLSSLNSFLLFEELEISNNREGSWDLQHSNASRESREEAESRNSNRNQVDHRLKKIFGSPAVESAKLCIGNADKQISLSK